MALEESQGIATRMADRIRHRGPDAGESWADPAAGVALSHRRLSIIDLSPAGAQPMASADGRWHITFNGEIYNFPELRTELEAVGTPFRGHSDTEVLLAAVSAWGLERTLERANGMFAFALWDRLERRLFLARDRVGEKPLYFGPTPGGGWVFGSELKALRQFPGFEPPVDRGALALFLRHGYVPSPWSIYQGVRKVRPGTLVTLAHGQEQEERAYWSAAEAWERGAREPFAGTADEALIQVEALLRDSVRMRMHADVPLGAFLSGGIDSSIVVALMQAQSSRPVQTFTIGFREEAFDEARMAREVARHLGTNHTELYVTGEEALAVVPRLPELYDEPFADSSQIPTFLVSQLARQHVTVSLSGDGGDELFGGYTRYPLAEAAWSALSRVPDRLRRPLASLVRGPSAGPWDSLLGALEPWLPVRVSRFGSASRRRQIADLAQALSRQELYRALVSVWHSPGSVVPAGQEPGTALSEPLPLGLRTFLAEMTYLDTVSYLPDDILVKVDRASMGVGLESRVPLLDHRLIELAATLPDDLKVRDGKQKWILRQVLHRHVPAALVERPKMGFGVPMAAWIRGPLREWARDLLQPRVLEDGGYLRAAPITALLDGHLSGKEDNQAHLWNVLAFESWRLAQRAERAGA